MKSHHITTGKKGEEDGVVYLRKMGYKVLERNFKTPFGEIDIITEEAGYIVFIEVKTRRDTSYGMPEEAVHVQKQAKLIKSAQSYLKKNGWLERLARFDVLSILMGDRDGPNFRLVQDAFGIE